MQPARVQKLGKQNNAGELGEHEGRHSRYEGDDNVVHRRHRLADGERWGVSAGAILDSQCGEGEVDDAEYLQDSRE